MTILQTGLVLYILEAKTDNNISRFDCIVKTKMVRFLSFLLAIEKEKELINLVKQERNKKYYANASNRQCTYQPI
jgi:hypothetical protein